MLGPTLVVTGSITTEEDLEVHGTLRGQLAAPAHCVRLEGDARVEADVLARDITVLGQASGKFTATEIIDIRATHACRGRSPRRAWCSRKARW